MPSLDSTFEELRAHLRQPEALNPAKSDPFFYFVHEPEETLAVKQKVPVWRAALEQDGWNIAVVSFADLLWSVIDGSGRWEEWLQLEPDADPPEINEAVRSVVRNGGRGLVAEVARHVALESPRRVVLFTDTAVLHPYFRIRTLESALHGQVKSPAVIFYPGRRSGQYGLRFLGFYPVDGNYRSSLVGGQP